MQLHQTHPARQAVLADWRPLTPTVHAPARRASQVEDQKQIEEAQRGVLSQVVQHVISMPLTPRPTTLTTGSEPVSPAKAGKTMRAASAEVSALLEAAQQSRRAPTGRQTPYLTAVSWMGMDPEAVAQMTENDYWLKVFFTGIIPEEFKEMPWMVDNGVDASSVITSMPRLEESLMSAEHMDDLDACMYESAEKHDSGVFMPPPKRAASDRARAVIAIDNYSDHEAHIQKWRALFNMGALADDTWLRRLSNMKQAVWFYLTTSRRGASARGGSYSTRGRDCRNMCATGKFTCWTTLSFGTGHPSGRQAP